MKETIYNLLAQQGDMTWQQIIMHILVSAVIGLFIFISYVISHKGTIYSKKFGVTLIVLTVMTGTVMTVILHCRLVWSVHYLLCVFELQ